MVQDKHKILDLRIFSGCMPSGSSLSLLISEHVTFFIEKKQAGGHEKACHYHYEKQNADIKISQGFFGRDTVVK